MNNYSAVVRVVVVFACVLVPVVASAQVVISEIMYDVEGTDADQEWIEVYNAGSESVNLVSFRLAEAGTDHEITQSSGDGDLEPGERAIIAANPTAFAGLWSSGGAAIFDSSFSLSNTGETLALKDANLDTTDTVTYDSGWGAAGDGASLQKIAGSWQAGKPTPGGVNIASKQPQTPAPEEKTHPTLHVAQPVDRDESDLVLVDNEADISVNIGSDRTVLVGSDQVLTASVENYHESDITYTWNFGDGTQLKASKSNQSAHHAWQYPGTYVVVVQVSGSGYQAENRTTVRVLPADIVVGRFRQKNTDYIQIINNTPTELDLSGWSVRIGSRYYLIPYDTYVLPDASLALHVGSEYGISSAPGLTLLYPDGRVVATERSATSTLASSKMSIPISVAKQAEHIKSDVTVGEPTSAAQLAAVGSTRTEVPVPASTEVATTSPDKQTAGVTKWYIALIALLGAATLGILVLSQRRSLADEFEIIAEEV
jgi:hypothetical protein